MLVNEHLVSRFLFLSNRESVADILGTSDAELVRILYSKPLQKSYTTFYIPKKNGATRRIDAPQIWLKRLQRRLHNILSMIYNPKSSVSAYIEDRGIVFNAQKHIAKKWVFNIDLINFFPTINFGRVRGMFMALPFELSPQVASILAQICCYNNGLPQGAPTSPIISNMICARMDTALYHLARSCGCNYSRYADDITFSTYSNHFPQSIADVGRIDGELTVTTGEALVNIIQSNGFEINNQKIKMNLKGARQVVTGIVVNEKINCRRSYIKTLRGQINALEKHGERASELYTHLISRRHSAPFRANGSLAQHLLGKLSYVKMLKGSSDRVYRRLKHRLDIALGIESFFYETLEDEIGAGLWVIEHDDGEQCDQGTGFFVNDVGLVTCAHVIGENNYAYKFNNPSEKFSLSVVCRDTDRDLAILNFTNLDTSRIYKFQLRTSGDINTGDQVILAGFPEHAPGATPAIEHTTVTAFRNRSGVRKIQISATVFYGNSGGPLLDTNLRIVGVADRGAGEGVSTAIHFSELLQILSTLNPNTQVPAQSI